MDLNVITLKSKKTNAKTNLGEVALKGVTDDARHDSVLRTSQFQSQPENTTQEVQETNNSCRMTNN